MNYYFNNNTQPREISADFMKRDIMINLNDFDKILVGIGSFIDTKIDENIDEIAKYEFVKNSETKEFYGDLVNLLEGRDYFVVTTCRDGKLLNCGLKNVVAPCGSFKYLQCVNDCQHELLQFEEKMISDSKKFICPHCGSKVVFNRLPLEKYNEGGYMEAWEEYNRWLQSTINKRLLIIELGVDMSYPTVIRFATEKLCFFNQKSKMYRVHESLAFATPEIKDRCECIMQDPLLFMKENF